MAGVNNRTARQFNLRCIGENGNRVVVRICPGFNSVNDGHWSAFVRKNHIDPYVKELKKQGHLEFGTKQDDMELDTDPDTICKSKSEPIAKAKADLVQSKIDLANQELINSKNQDEAKLVKVKLETAELELVKLKKELAKYSDTELAKSKDESKGKSKPKK